MAMALGMFTVFQVVLAQPNPNSPTTQWVPILYGNGNYPDPSADQQTGSAESDIVGNVSEPSLYMQYNSGYLGFRLRVGADVSPAGFKGDAFVGLDANGGAALNLFIGVDNSGSPNQLGIWDPGAGLNTSPSTTSIVSTPIFSYTETATDYGFTPVNATINPGATNFDLNADGKPDQFLTFYVPFTNIVSALAAKGITGFTTNSPMQLVAATATQPNSLNEDLNGVNGGINSSLTWSQLGGITLSYSPDGVAPIPEPSAGTFAVLAIIVTFCQLVRAKRS
jgi:large repetitive protein